MVCRDFAHTGILVDIFIPRTISRIWLLKGHQVKIPEIENNAPCVFFFLNVREKELNMFSVSNSRVGMC